MMMTNFNTVPPEMRDLASKSVEQAKKAFDGFFDAAAKNNQDGQEQGRLILAQAEKQVEASLDFARRLSMAKSLEEIAAIQKEYFTSAFQEAAVQMQELSSSVQKNMEKAGEAFKPKA
jgi:hypothetical protein